MQHELRSTALRKKGRTVMWRQTAARPRRNIFFQDCRIPYLTEPVTPSTKRFCWVKKRITVGSVMIVTLSMSRP